MINFTGPTDPQEHEDNEETEEIEEPTEHEQPKEPTALSFSGLASEWHTTWDTPKEDEPKTKKQDKPTQESRPNRNVRTLSMANWRRERQQRW